MRARLLSLTVFLAIAGAARAAGDPQIIDLGNGAEVVIKDGQVEVRDRPGSSAKSSSNSVSSSSDGNGTTTTVVSERDGQSVTRTIHISRDGKVTVDGQPAAQPAAEPRAGGWMGVRSAPVSDALRAQIELPEGQGIVLEIVAPEGPAARAGLQVHDILLTLNGLPLISVEEFRAALRAAMPGAQLPVTYLRKGKQAEVTVTLDAPPAQPAEGSGESDAQRILREMREAQAGGKASGKARVIGPDGKWKELEGGDAFDLLLNDPNVPETMKEQIRRSREAMKPKPVPQPPEQQ